MEIEYRCKNGTIIVELPESCDREKLKRLTNEFLKKVMSEVKNNGNSNTRKNI